MTAFFARLLARAFVVLALILSAACGFKPLYAIDEEAGPQSLRNMHIANITGDDGARAAVMEAFRHRTAQSPSAARYDLTIDTDESAASLAVQVDASVTRFNYRLIGQYRLLDRETRRVIEGSTTAIASFNVINSQYATLTAERDARRKAATMLANQIEREILLRLAERQPATESNDTDDKAATGEAVRDLDKTDLYRDQPIDPARQ